jgi:hypothetical protein
LASSAAALERETFTACCLTSELADTMKMRTFESLYHQRLQSMPSPGQGRHPALLAIANLGILAGKPPADIHADVRQATSAAPMPDREIQGAITKASADHLGAPMYKVPPKPAPLVKDGNAARQRIIDQGTISEDVDLWECSPLRLMESPGRDSAMVLKTLFKPWEFVFIGGGKEVGNLGQNIRTAADWIAFFESGGGTAGPYILINPLSGEPAPKKSGDGDSMRGDSNVKTFRHCLVEFDDLGREDQLRFWSAAKLPIRALVDSGGKSIHAWLDVQKIGNVTTADEWDAHIKRGLYDRLLTPFGVDRACSNPARLSRLPGCIRAETGRAQRLLWLSSDGREVVR